MYVAIFFGSMRWIDDDDEYIVDIVSCDDDDDEYLFNIVSCDDDDEYVMK